MDKYNKKLKDLILKLECSNIIFSNKGSIVEVDIIRVNERHSYVIKPNGIDSTSYNDTLNSLVIKYCDKLIDLAKYETKDTEF